jgi:DNA-binding winged helix-turn-helix (wHTH) protein/TolB-like protein
LETLDTSNNGHSAGSLRYAFGEFEVDAAERTCIRAGEIVPLTGKVFDVLLAFVEDPNRLLSKDDLMERVWHNEFVEEGNLARNISTLRKALGDNGKEHKYIATVQGRGYRFVADVRSIGREKPEPIGKIEDSTEVRVDSLAVVEPVTRESHKLLWVLITVVVIFAVSWFEKDRFFAPSPNIKSLAVMPLRGIDPNDNYLGFGITETIIRRLGSSGQLAVRPTSAVIHYLNQEPDSLGAARELNVDAVLEGTVQRFGDKMRVSVNLLRTSDGISIWNENFNIKADDVFRIQDEVAEQVADKLKIRLSSPILAATNKYPVDQRAYEFYLKGMFGLDARAFDKGNIPHMLNTIDLFQQAVNVDPNYAMAHGQLAFCYTWMAMFLEPNEKKWVSLARQEIDVAEKLDPDVAEAHIASGLLDWSTFGGYKNEDAIKEFRLAKQLNPAWNAADLIALYAHVGLDELATRELNRGLTSDPTSQALNGLTGISFYLNGDADGWYALNPTKNIDERFLAPWYLLRKGELDHAQRLLDDRIKIDPDDYHNLMLRALLLALMGKTAEADAQITDAFSKVPHDNESYHHQTYLLACTKSVEGDTTQAVKWLRETANSGYPNYRLFASDPFLDRIRQSPEFIQFLAEQKAQYERFQQEFSDL